MRMVKKVKLSVTSHEYLEEGMECYAYILTLTPGTTRMAFVGSARTLPPGKFLGAHFCQRLNGLQGYGQKEYVT